MSFNSCYSKCREQFLVNSESTLKAQLIEFRDHKLITSKKVSKSVQLKCFHPRGRGTPPFFITFFRRRARFSKVPISTSPVAVTICVQYQGFNNFFRYLKVSVNKKKWTGLSSWSLDVDWKS